MNFSAGLLPYPLYWIATGLFASALGYAIYAAPWKGFKSDPRWLNVFLGSCVALLVLWQMQAGLRPGMSFHILGGTLFVLMFGWQLAFVGVSLVVVGTTLNGTGDFYSLPLNALIMAGIPVGISYGILRFAVRYLPHNFFVYVLGNAFFCGALSMMATITVSTLLMLVFSPYTMEKIVSGYVVFAPLMIFAEAFFTGLIASSLVLFRPEWISTFDDRRYLSGK